MKWNNINIGDICIGIKGGYPILKTSEEEAILLVVGHLHSLDMTESADEGPLGEFLILWSINQK